LLVDDEQLHRNYEAVQRAHGRQVMAVVKGDGYGHGLLTAARAFQAAGARSLGVWSLEEAFELRAHGFRRCEIVVLQGFDYQLKALQAATVEDVVVVAGDRSVLDHRAAGLRVHPLIETGLGRGALTPRAALALAGDAASFGLHVDGVAVHFPSLPSAAEEAALRRELSPLVARPDALHVGGSDALALDVQLPVRAGRLLYGVVPSIPRMTQTFGTAVREARTWLAQGRVYPAPAAVLGYDRAPVATGTPVLEIAAGYGHGLPADRQGWIVRTEAGAWTVVSTAMNVSWAVPADPATAADARRVPCRVLLAGRTSWAEIDARDLATATAASTSSVLTAPRPR
jgi:alanine racemase